MSLKRTPRWAKWRLMPEVEAWEAVSLSLGIEPTEVRYERMAWMGAAHPFAEDDEFSDRLDVLRANRSNREHFPSAGSIDIASWYKCSVKLSEFARFARFAGWDIPEELACLAPVGISSLVRTAAAPQLPAEEPWCELIAEIGVPLRFGDLARIIAEALHPSDDEFTCAVTRINLDDELSAAVRDGKLIVRNPSGLGRHTFTVGAALQDAVVLPQDIRPFLADRGMGLRLVDHNTSRPQGVSGRSEQSLAKAPRLEPEGGDSLTPVIWRICYDLEEERRKVTARPVMAVLKSMAETGIHPLICATAGGVKFEYEKGE